MNFSPDRDNNTRESDGGYWYNFWNQRRNVCTGCPQKDVWRTRNGAPVTEAQWERTIEYIANLIGLKSRDTLIELCCGNALILGQLADRCAKATGVDFSRILLEQAQEMFPNAFEMLHGDVLEIDLPDNSEDVALIYFAIQHFNQKDAVRLIQKTVNLLKPGGRLLVGDIPDASKLWQYLDKPEYRKDYIQRILECRPMIGTWFDREFFEAVGEYLGGVDAEVFEQPDFLINANERFDVLYTKHGS